MAERLEVVSQFQEEGHAVQRILKFSEVANSTWYSHQKQGVGVDGRKKNKGRPVPGFTVSSQGLIIPDSEIISIIGDYRSRPEFINAGGYHKLSHYIKRDFGFTVNHKKVYRLCREKGFLLPRKKKKKRFQGRISQNRVVNKPNRLWELDLKYGYIHGENRFFFILPILDVFTRLVVNYHIGLRCLATDLVFTLKYALCKYNVEQECLIIRTDRGTQMTSNLFLEYVSDQGEEKLIHELIPPATPNKNAHIEAFNSILEIEFLQVFYFETYGQAYGETVNFIDKYNHQRIHGSLGYKTPHEIYQLYCKGENTGLGEIKL